MLVHSASEFTSCWSWEKSLNGLIVLNIFTSSSNCKIELFTTKDMSPTYISTQKQPNCKKRCGPCKKGCMKKVVKSKVVTQKWLWWSDNGKNFNNNISGKFVLPPPTGNRHQNSPEMLLLKILPLSDHHSHFWAATFDFITFFHAAFLHELHLFLQFGCFCVDFFFFFVI